MLRLRAFDDVDEIIYFLKIFFYFSCHYSDCIDTVLYECSVLTIKEKINILHHYGGMSRPCFHTKAFALMIRVQSVFYKFVNV